MKNVPGTTDALHEKLEKRDVKILYPTDILIAIHLKNLCRQMIQEFDQIETLDVKKPRVGIVGEILVKFTAKKLHINLASIIYHKYGECKEIQFT